LGQQREEGQFPKQVSKSSSLFPLSVKSEPAEEGASLAAGAGKGVGRVGRDAGRGRVSAVRADVDRGLAVLLTTRTSLAPSNNLTHHPHLKQKVSCDSTSKPIGLQRSANFRRANELRHMRPGRQLKL
jgi:hypothetical protein